MEDKLYPKECPVCHIATNDAYKIIDNAKDESLWYKCTCGVIFQSDKPIGDTYQRDVLMEYKTPRDFEVATLFGRHTAKAYASVIENITYGRRMLDVGFQIPYVMDFMRERGWIVEGMDVNKLFENKPDITVADFEEHEKFKYEYNLIWMAHVLEHFIDPLMAVQKAYAIMPEDGVLFIATPDIDFMSKAGVANWGHFDKKEHYVLWSERALVRELERIGFNIVLKYRNFHSRFPAHYDVHLIAQKRYY